MFAQVKLTKKTALILLAIIGGAALYYADHSSTHETKKIAVQVQPVKIRDVSTDITAVGTLKALQDISLSAQTNGYITQINFHDGDAVKTGQVLFQLDNVKEQAALMAAQADYTAETNKYDRMQLLFKTHDISQQDLDLMQAELQAKAATFKEAQDTVNKKCVSAPFGGELCAKSVNLGDFVNPGQKLIELVDRSALTVNYSVPEKYFELIQLKQPVQITTATIPAKSVWGNVTYVAPAVDPETHTLAIEANIPNQNNVLAPGLFVTVEQVIKDNQKAMLVPEESIVKTLDKTIVYKVVKQKAVAVPVIVGDVQDGYVEILAGLTPNDVIVVAGQEKLQNGDDVVVVK